MTQRDLALKVGVGVPHISKVEAGRESPSEDLLGRIATAFGLDPDEMLLVARRLPPDIVEDFASDPTKALMFLRQWKAVE
jgi:transcriptional regulator with XRE-family HTH domain